MQPRLQQAADIVHAWCAANFMEVNVGKCELLVVGNGEVRPRFAKLTVKCGGKDVQRTPVARVLGVMVDEALTMQPHVEHITKEASARLAQLRCLAGASWGPKKRDMRTFYMGYCCSVMLYACAAWWPLLTKAQIEKLECLHRRAARLITGCAMAVDTSSLLLEADMMPLGSMATQRTAKYVEQSLRLPHEHIRHRLASSIIFKKVWSLIDEATMPRCRANPSRHQLARSTSTRASSTASTSRHASQASPRRTLRPHGWKQATAPWPRSRKLRTRCSPTAP